MLRERLERPREEELRRRCGELVAIARDRWDEVAAGPVRDRVAAPSSRAAARRRGDRLDRRLVLLHHARQPARPAGARGGRARGIAGESWEIHGGGFYRVEKFRSRPSGCPDAALVQVGGVHDLALGLRAARRPLLPERRPVPRRPVRPLSDGLVDRDLHRRCSPSPGSSTTLLCRTLRNELVLGAVVLGLTTLAAWGSDRAVRAARRLAAGRRDARDDHGRERLLRDHPGALGARPREGAGASPTRGRRSRQAALGPQQLLHAAGACSRCWPATSRARTRTLSWLVLVALMAIGAWSGTSSTCATRAGTSGGSRSRPRSGSRSSRWRSGLTAARAAPAAAAGAVRAGAGDRRGALRPVPLGAPDAGIAAPLGIGSTRRQQIARAGAPRSRRRRSTRSDAARERDAHDRRRARRARRLDRPGAKIK